VHIRSGTVHALVGENGAGKSTLMKILAGVEHADGGQVIVDGRETHYRTPHAALADGVTIIAQELSLEPQRTVLENVFLGVESTKLGMLDRRAMRKRYKELAARVELEVSPDAQVGRLRTAEQQKVEILRALARQARLVIMDEPTAALTTHEANRLLDTVRDLRASGTTVIYVSHFLAEVLAIADEVTVLRDGQHVRTAVAAEETPASLVTSMLGRASDLSFPDPGARPTPSENVLTVRGLSRSPDFVDISFELHAGEIVGLAGLIGSGRSEIARAIFGADPVDAGTITLCGRELRKHRPRDSVRQGLVMLPESRKDQGLLMRQPIMENVTLPHLRSLGRGGLVNGRKAHRETQRIVQTLDVRGQAKTQVNRLSGGNQQKTMFAKWLLRPPRVFIIDEPTRGVDVGAKHAIYELIDSLARDGMAVLVISSEIEEVLGLSDRILVMRNGRLTAEFKHGEASDDLVLRAAFGAHEGEENTRAANEGAPR
jgi:simple sugar transport system ATP-binding protein/ribose transport system ATP-binding protein